MKENKEALTYREKLKTYSDNTLKLIMSMNDTSEKREAKHRIVMESETEQEVVEKLKKLNTPKT